MKKYILKTTLMLAVFSAITFNACKREKWDSNDTTTTEDQSLAEATENDIFKQSDDAVTHGSEYLKTGDAETLTGPCATVTIDSNSNPKKAIIDFGPVNCACNDGKNRRGKIIITHSGKFRTVGSIMTATTQDFYVNDNKVELTKTVTCTAPLTWTIEVKNGKITIANGGGTITWSTSRTRKMTAGAITPFILSDDKYEINGSASGTNRGGIAYTMSITAPLIVDFSCVKSRVTKGVITFTAAGKADRSIDFGNGTCDDEALVTVGKNSKTIVLKR
ncbi:MAG: hypothetical protein SGJ10_09875 [Bacteroidota bacterium]|nr:hypothetical protein [Bacteroidota bacterium]